MPDSGSGTSTLVLALAGSAVTLLSTRLGALPALAARGISRRSKDVLMGLGSMLYVVSDEMIPESHRQQYAREATAGLMLGFVLMMFLDVTLS